MHMAKSAAGASQGLEPLHGHGRIARREPLSACPKSGQAHVISKPMMQHSAAACCHCTCSHPSGTSGGLCRPHTTVNAGQPSSKHLQPSTTNRAGRAPGARQWHHQRARQKHHWVAGYHQKQEPTPLQSSAIQDLQLGKPGTDEAASVWHLRSNGEGTLNLDSIGGLYILHHTEHAECATPTHGGCSPTQSQAAAPTSYT